jgi:hypothetical protein
MKRVNEKQRRELDEVKKREEDIIAHQQKLVSERQLKHTISNLEDKITSMEREEILDEDKEFTFKKMTESNTK